MVELNASFEENAQTFQTGFGESTELEILDAVRYTEQKLTDTQKAQARKNIGAAAPGEGGGSSAEGAVLYTTQTLTEEQQAQARENIGAASVEAVGKSITLYPSNFVNGLLTVGTGVSPSGSWICTPNPVSVKKGEKITVKPNGMAGIVYIESVDNFANVTRHLKDISFSTEDIAYVSEYDGFVFVMARDAGWLAVTPNSFVCDISIGETRIDVLENQVKTFDEKIESVKKKTLSTSPKHKPFTRIVNDCQTTSDWYVSVAADTTNFILGTQSVRSTSQMRTIKHKYDMVNNDLVIKFKIHSIAPGAQLLLSVAHAAGGGRVVYVLASNVSWTVPTDWQEVAIPYTGYRYGALDGFDFSTVDDLIIQSAEGAVDWSVQYVGLRPKALKNGIVTFTFDDGYKTQYTGIKALAEKGITGTVFHIKESTGSDETMTVADLQNLVNYYGADIEVHGHPGYDQWAEDDLVKHWEDSQKWLKENGLSDGKHMAYPQGQFPENVVQLAKRYFDSCRTITPFIPIEAYPPADRYRIRAVSGVSANGTTIATIKDDIDRAVASGAWLILVFHRIGDGTDSMWCTEADLKDIADYAINSGAHIMNYAEVFDSGIIKG